MSIHEHWANNLPIPNAFLCPTIRDSCINIVLGGHVRSAVSLSFGVDGEVAVPLSTLVC